MPDNPRGFLLRSRLERLVSGLRDFDMSSNVKVFSAETGKLLRIEQTIITKSKKSRRQ